jgi:hypothetical protein
MPHGSKPGDVSPGREIFAGHLKASFCSLCPEKILSRSFERLVMTLKAFSRRRLRPSGLFEYRQFCPRKKIDSLVAGLGPHSAADIALVPSLSVSRLLCLSGKWCNPGNIRSLSQPNG